MNDTISLDKELAELKEFVADLKADRAAQKEKERRESWTKYTSMSLVVVAVLTALATQWAGKYSGRAMTDLNEATFKQAQASDQWSYYQAKSIKQNLYEALRESSPTENVAVSAPGPIRPVSTLELQPSGGTLNGFNGKVAKYESEKAKISAEARTLEKARDDARTAAIIAGTHAGGMSLAIILLQVAIALSSICLMTKRRPLWYVSLGLTTVAAAKMAQVIWWS